jgi:hypothetical protein
MLNRNILHKPLAALALAALLACASHARADGACALNKESAPDKPVYFPAIAQGPASDAEVAEQTRIAVERSGAPVSPAYVKLPRIIAIYKDPAGKTHRTIAAVISGPLPARGAHITLATRYRDPNALCAFIPWTVAQPGSSV